jgi:transposase-like protein
MPKQVSSKLEFKQRRSFSEEFKKSKVKDLLEKRTCIKDISEVYEVSRTAVYKWVYKYSASHERKPILVVQMESEEQKTKDLLRRVAELERTVGQKQLEIDFLNRVLELGSEELGFDLKKNFSTRLSSGTGSNDKNTSGK